MWDYGNLDQTYLVSDIVCVLVVIDLDMIHSRQIKLYYGRRKFHVKVFHKDISHHIQVFPTTSNCGAFVGDI